MSDIEAKYIGIIEYAKALEMQHKLFDAIVESKAKKSEIENICQQILLLEHTNVYTLGKSGNESNLLVNKEFLSSIGASYFHTDRGGDVTFHGLGQLVGYPILDLETLELSLKEYIWALEQGVIMTVAEYGIIAERLEGATGVWVESTTTRARKICAIGVRASRWVTMHGFALNVTTDLNYFAHINPCGFTNKGVTSIERETSMRPPLDEVAAKFTKHFASTIKRKITFKFDNNITK